MMLLLHEWHWVCTCSLHTEEAVFLQEISEGSCKEENAFFCVR